MTWATYKGARRCLRHARFRCTGKAVRCTGLQVHSAKHTLQLLLRHTVRNAVLAFVMRPRCMCVWVRACSRRTSEGIRTQRLYTYTIASTPVHLLSGMRATYNESWCFAAVPRFITQLHVLAQHPSQKQGIHWQLC